MMIFLAQQEISRREIDSASALAMLQCSLCSDVRCALMFAVLTPSPLAALSVSPANRLEALWEKRQRSLRANVRCAHSFAFDCAVRSVKSVYELIICVEIRVSDDICTMDPTFVYMLVKSKNQYTGNFGFSLKTADFMRFWYIFIVLAIFVV